MDAPQTFKCRLEASVLISILMPLYQLLLKHNYAPMFYRCRCAHILAQLFLARKSQPNSKKYLSVGYMSFFNRSNRAKSSISTRVSCFGFSSSPNKFSSPSSSLRPALRDFSTAVKSGRARGSNSLYAPACTPSPADPLQTPITLGIVKKRYSGSLAPMSWCRRANPQSIFSLLNPLRGSENSRLVIFSVFSSGIA